MSAMQSVWYNALDLAERHVEHQPDAARQRLQEPDVRDRAGQLDVRHSFTAHFRLGDLDAALLTHNAAMLQPLVFAAQTLVVLDRTEDLGAEKPVAFRLECTIVDGLRLLDLAERPGSDHVRRSKTDADCIKVVYGILVLK